METRWLSSTEGTYVQLHEPIVITVEFHPQRPKLRKLLFTWKGRQYMSKEVSGYHNELIGESLVHYFSVMAAGKFFEIGFDSRKLEWFIKVLYEPN